MIKVTSDHVRVHRLRTASWGDDGDIISRSRSRISLRLIFFSSRMLELPVELEEEIVKIVVLDSVSKPKDAIPYMLVARRFYSW